jgi:hypothetical protein
MSKQEYYITLNIAYTGNMGGNDAISSNNPEPDWSGK